MKTHFFNFYAILILFFSSDSLGGRIKCTMKNEKNYDNKQGFRIAKVKQILKSFHEASLISEKV